MNVLNEGQQLLLVFGGIILIIISFTTNIWQFSVMGIIMCIPLYALVSSLVWIEDRIRGFNEWMKK